ncbi:MAG TPA: prolipoprotein diacylglyceryl transferase [Lachnospiraceae bacterium]|nr:prolipoprotein diacylglyceryl transferase [Lachnospiraceae bacterium]
MYNDILSIGPITVHGYGLMIAIGVLSALFVGEARAKKRNMNSDILYPMTFLCVVFGFASAKLLFCIVEFKDFFNNPISVLSGNGFVVYGGIMGGALTAYIICRIKKLKFVEYFDLMLPSVALAQGFGRIGCFLAGCCYGRETDSRIGIMFTHSNFAPNGIKLLPTQLISSGGMFIIAVVLFIYARKERRAGKVGALYLILYSIGRFLVEFLRNDYRGEVGFLSTSQFISLFILIFGIIIFIGKKRSQEE